jgi:hypothetical protein
MNEEIAQLLKDLKNNVIPLDPETQRSLVVLVSEAYGGAEVAVDGKTLVSGSTGLPVSSSPVNFPAMPSIKTIGEAETAIVNSFIPMVVETALQHQTSVMNAGEIVSIGDEIIQNALRGS